MRERCLKAGAAAYLIKPVERDTVCNNPVPVGVGLADAGMLCPRRADGCAVICRLFAKKLNS